jgi:hypothetical protein
MKINVAIAVMNIINDQNLESSLISSKSGIMREKRIFVKNKPRIGYIKPYRHEIVDPNIT